MRRRTLLLVAIGLLAAACGDSGSSPTTPATSAAATPAETTSPPDTTPPPTTADAGASTSTPATTEPAPGPEAVTFETADGVTLEATKHGAQPEWVVLAHMRPADMTSWSDFSLTLVNNGFTSLAFNFRGYGNSGGSGFDVETDVLAAIDYALAQGAEHVFVIGASMGGTGAIAAAAKRDVAGVATLSAPDRFEGADAISAVPMIAAPKLFVAGDQDANYATIAQGLFDAAGAPKQLEVFESSAHGTDLFDAGVPLLPLLLDFLGALGTT